MSLTQTDLLEIRKVVKDVVQSSLDERLAPIENELKALRNDIKIVLALLRSYLDILLYRQKYAKTPGTVS